MPSKHWRTALLAPLVLALVGCGLGLGGAQSQGAKQSPRRAAALSSSAPKDSHKASMFQGVRISTGAAKALIRQFYTDINDQDYNAAFLLMAPNLHGQGANAEQSFAAGYRNTPRVHLKILGAQPTPGAQSVVVPVRLQIPTSGYVTVYEGTYTVGTAAGGLRITDAKVPPGVSVGFDSLQMLTVDDGLAWNAKSLFLTKDGGSTWKEITPQTLDAQESLAAVTFHSASVGWAVSLPDSAHGSSTLSVYRTLDGGSSWQRTRVALPKGFLATSVVSLNFQSTQNGSLLVASRGTLSSETVTLLQTRDGGRSWQSIYDQVPMQSYPSGSLTPFGNKLGPVFIDGQNGWITGSSSTNHVYLYRTKDGGNSWNAQSTPLFCTCIEPIAYPPRFFSSKWGLMAVAAARSPNPNRTEFGVYQTKDGGNTWQLSSQLMATEPLTGVHDFLDKQHAWVLAGDLLYGASAWPYHWSLLSQGSALMGVTQIDFVTPQVGFAVRTHRTASGLELPQLLASYDGGVTWTVVTTTINARSGQVLMPSQL